MTWGELRALCVRLAQVYGTVLDEPGRAQYIEQFAAQVKPSEECCPLTPEQIAAMGYELEPLLMRAVVELLKRNAQELLDLQKSEPRCALIVGGNHTHWLAATRMLRPEQVAVEQAAAARVTARLHDIHALNLDRVRFGLLTPFPVG